MSIKSDYTIIDTNPGIPYCSINALVVADVLLLTLKMDESRAFCWHQRSHHRNLWFTYEIRSYVLLNFLTSEARMEVIFAIQCFCDTQFSRKEFLTVLHQAEHPFANKFELSRCHRPVQL